MSKISTVMAIGMLCLSMLSIVAFRTSALSPELPNVEWSKTYGGPYEDLASSIVQTGDGGYVLAGRTYPAPIAGYMDAWVVRVNSGGNPQWTRSYGGSQDDAAYSLVQTTDGDYAFAGYTGSFGVGYNDVWLVKIDVNGNVIWSQTYGGYDLDEARALIQTNDSGYAIAGFTDSCGAGGHDFYFVKTDGDGNMQWNKTYGGPTDDVARSVVQTSDGGYALAGYRDSVNSEQGDFWLVRTDANGNMVWNRTYGGAGSDQANSLALTHDGRYVLAGWTESFGAGGRDAWMVKTDADGYMQWNKTYGGSDADWTNSVVVTSDGGYALAGATGPSTSGNLDFWLVKTDSSGNMEWDKKFGKAEDDDEAYCVILACHEGYALAGRTYPSGDRMYANALLVKVGPSRACWVRNAGNPLNLGVGWALEPWVTYDQGLFKMWYSGRDPSNALSYRIYYATSSDGVSWTPHGMVLDVGEAGDWDATALERPVVLFDGAMYRMWYAGYTPGRYGIGYADSTDGIHWTKYEENPVMRPGKSGDWDSRDLGVFTVIKDGASFRMLYNGYGSNGIQKIGVATSDNGIIWVKYSNNPVLTPGPDAWDSYHIYTGPVIKKGNHYLMWYSGQQSVTTKIGLAISFDGFSWSKYRSNPVFDVGSSEAWDSAGVFSGAIIEKQDGTMLMWYWGFPDPSGNLGTRIGLATCTAHADSTPPTTLLSIGEPKFVFGDLTYTTHDSVFVLKADDGPGFGVDKTAYRVSNGTYDSGWIRYSMPFSLDWLSDGSYTLSYNSTDKAGNVEPTSTVDVAVDNKAPSTKLAVGEPKYMRSNTPYVTPCTPFSLHATDDSGSGSAASFYSVWNATYDSGWSTYANVFFLAGLSDGNYTISYHTTDNLGNKEIAKTAKVSLFSWNLVYVDSFNRGTALLISTKCKLFQFVAPNKDFGIKHDANMIVLKPLVIICYHDSSISIVATAIRGDFASCVAVAKELKTGKQYVLVSRPSFIRYGPC